MVEIIIPYNGIQYSDGIGGGSSLKFAVKVANFVTLSFASGSSDDLTPKKSAIESQVEAEVRYLSVESNYPLNSLPSLQIQNLHLA